MSVRSYLNSVAILVCFTVLFSGCQNESQKAAPEPVRQETISNNLLASQLQVRDAEGAPISGAHVLIGSAVDVPFKGNYLTVDAKGDTPIPRGWSDAQPVTVDAPGYIRATFLSRKPATHELRLRPIPISQRHEVRGEAKNFGNLKRDGFLDVALVVPAVTRGELLNFQVSSLISTDIDTIKLPLGQRLEAPSNLALPYQRESYMLPITFEKPFYRLFLPTAESQRLVALHGRFPLKQMVDGIRGGKSVFDVLNLLDFQGAGLRDVQPGVPPILNDIPVDEMPFTKTVHVQAPPFASQYAMLALPLVETGGYVFPSDLKRVGSGLGMDLKFPASSNTPGLILAVLRDAATDSGTVGPAVDCFSAVIRPADSTPAFDFIPITGAPELRASTLVLDPPKAPASVEPSLTYALLSRVETRSAGGIAVEAKQPVWEVFANQWSSSFDIPAFPETAPQPGSKFRWEVFYLGDEIKGGQKPRPRPIGPAALETVSHVSKNAVDLQ